MTERLPTSLAGFTIHTPIEFGVFGQCYVGFQGQEGRRILKVLRHGEDLAIADEDFERLRTNEGLVAFEPRQQTEDGRRILAAHFMAATALGALVQGSELQRRCEKAARELDANADSMQALRATSLEQRVGLVLGLARTVAALHAEKRTAPYLTPWNALFVAGTPKLVDVGLGFQSDKLDLSAIHEDALAYFAPEVLRALVEKRAVQVGPAADVYALGLTARSILLERAVEYDGGSKREAILGGHSWKRTPHERFSNRLDALLSRAASTDPGRRPTASAFAKELEAIQRERSFDWTPPSKGPRVVAGALVVLILAAAILWAVIPPSPETVARKKYAQATNAKTAAQRLEVLKQAPAPSTGKLSEIAKLEAIALLEQGAQAPRPAVAALYEFGRHQPAADADGLTARFLAAFVQRWALLDQIGAKKELTEIAQAAPADPSAHALPGLAACALRVAPFGVEGGELKPNEASDWLALTREARAADAALVRSWPVPAGYERSKDVQSVSYGAGWVAKLLAGRLESLLRDDGAEADLKEASDAFPIFATRAAYALQLARSAKDEADVAKARDVLAEALKLKGDDQPFGEGALALADLALSAARLAKSDLAKLRDAQRLYLEAKNAKPATPGLDLAAAAERGRLEACREIGALIAQPPGTLAPELLREAENDLNEFIAANEKDKSRQQDVADAHVSLGLVLDDQPSRLAEAYEHLAFVYNDGEPKSGYRRPDNPANVLATRAFFEKCRSELKELTSAERPDTEREQALHAEIEAICRLEKLDTSSLPLLDARFHRKAADLLKGKKRLDALNASKKAFEEVFASNDTWAPGLEGRVEVTLTLCRETDDATSATSLLAEAQTFLDKSAEALKARKISAQVVAKTVDPQRLLVCQGWLDALARWLKARDDSPDLSEQDQSFVNGLLGAVESAGMPEVPESAKGPVAQAHFLLGRWNYSQRKWTEAVVQLAAALDQLPPENITARSQATLLAAEVALSQAENVRGDDAPWRGGAKGAETWARDILAKRLGAPSYRAFVDGIRSGKIQIISDELAAKRLVEDMLKNESAVTADDLALATKIDSKSSRAYLLLARAKQTAGAKLEAEAAAKTAFDLAGSERPDVALEAARIYFASCEPAELKAADFRATIERANSLSTAAAAKWRGDGTKLSTAFVPLYWLGRHHQAVADDRGGEDETARKEYGEAQKAYEDFKKACAEAKAGIVAEAADVDRRAVNCAIAKGQ